MGEREAAFRTFVEGSYEKEDVKITIIDSLGPKRLSQRASCRDTFSYDKDRGRICPMAMHVAFPYIDILRYGGAIPDQPEGTAVFCCPDVDVIHVFKLELESNK